MPSGIDSNEHPEQKSLGRISLDLVKSNGFFIIVLFFLGACWFFHLAWSSVVPTADASTTAVGVLHFQETSAAGKGCPCYQLYIKKSRSEELVSFVYADQEAREFIKGLKPTLDGKVVTVTWDQSSSHDWQRRILSIRDDRRQYLRFSQSADQIIRLNLKIIGVGSLLLLVAIGAVVNYFSQSAKHSLFINLERE